MNPQRYAVVAGKLALDWDDLQIELEGAELRHRCRCAACRYLDLSATAHILSEAVTAAAITMEVLTPHAVKPDAVTITALSPLGYGLQLHFSDGHNRGIYPWAYLREIAESLSVDKLMPTG